MSDRQWSIFWHTAEGLAMAEIPGVIAWLAIPNADWKVLLSGLLGALIQYLRAQQTVKA